MKNKLFHLIIFLSGLLLISISLLNLNLILYDIIYLIPLLFGIVFILYSFLKIKKILNELIYDVKEEEQRQKNIRDVYQYKQLLDPPETNN